MMPGVVAGFTSFPTIQIVAAYDTSSYGGYYDGSMGSITPAGASALPNTAPAVGASGEIIGLIYELYEGVERRLELTIRGNYESLPFTGLSIDGGSAITTWTRVYVDTTQTRFRHSPASNPIPAGTRALKFS
jgi:hypothetical protein